MSSLLAKHTLLSLRRLRPLLPFLQFTEAKVIPVTESTAKNRTPAEQRL